MTPHRRLLLGTLHAMLFGIYFLAGYQAGHRACPPPTVTSQANAALADQALANWKATLEVCEMREQILDVQIKRMLRRQKQQ